MSFWSSEKLGERIEAESLIEPYERGAIKSAAYELSLGAECFLTSDEDNTKDKLENHDQLAIPPGQFGLLISEEIVRVPSDAIAFISIKAGVKFRGLVNVSGFHVDPGFAGRLKFSVYNAGAQPVVLQRNQRVFLIWFADLDRETKNVYTGAHLDQKQISSEDVMRIQGKVASPAHLATRLTELEVKFKTWSGVMLTLVLGLGAAQLKDCKGSTQVAGLDSAQARIKTPTSVDRDDAAPDAEPSADEKASGDSSERRSDINESRNPTRSQAGEQ